LKKARDAKVNARPKSVPKARSKSAPQAKRGAGKDNIAAKQDPGDSFPIVAIGASAGGLEAFTEFFHALSPDTRMAFVLVQHLDPTHQSLLTEIIAKTTRISVEEVKSGTKVRPNRVYVIPPNYLMALAKGVLKLTPRSHGANRGQRQHTDALTINFFMCSLAEEQKEKAIGIVLSGTGGDGTSGLEAIKAEGGITFAQEPTSAKYDGMPRNAIDSGCVDFILSPGEIAKELDAIRHHSNERSAEADQEIVELGDSPSRRRSAQEKAFQRVIEQLRKRRAESISASTSPTPFSVAPSAA
jgi:two-component system CheB/CheR fusion protein